MLCEDRLHPSRRAILGAAGGLFAWSFAPRYAFAAEGRDPRLVVIVVKSRPIATPHKAEASH